MIYFQKFVILKKLTRRTKKVNRDILSAKTIILV